MFDNRGQINIIEAFLAIAIIFSAVVISSVIFPSSPDLVKPKSLADFGQEALIKLDTNGELGKLIAYGNWTAIKQSLDILLPIDVSFNLTVYDEDLNKLNSQAIQNTNLGHEVVLVDYVCASQNTTVQFFILRLQLGWSN
ncbi:hypothetical protein GWN65_01135 [Candidatus Bathyarchaeota archaeon]|nr:hypothetical protein [Candidatus Bathyarchaeota archaeon]NIV43557.1 hypothetical protein [Candidatus Bathyarchaeota archaeon]